MPRPATRAAAVTTACLTVLVAGCLGDAGVDADVTLPGVRTTSTVDDEFACGPLLFPAGCPIVRVVHVDSGCKPRVPGYVVCDMVVQWNATTGAVAPGTVLETTVNGTAGPSCRPMPGQPCVVDGEAAFRHVFSGPGQEAPWDLTVTARLQGAPPGADGRFTLTTKVVMRTEAASAADA